MICGSSEHPLTKRVELPPLYPTYRYGVVEEDLLRGGYPKDRNLRFLARLGLRSILSLTPEPPTGSVVAFAASHGISLIHIRVDKPKDNIPLSFPKVCQILPVLIDTTNLPIYVHCLDGSLVTSIVIMCLRKLQCWSPQSYIAECTRYIKEDMVSTEEAEFVEKFTGDFEISAGARLPKWLWNGQIPFKKHPTLKLRLSPAHVAQAQTSAVATDSMSSSLAASSGAVAAGQSAGSSGSSQQQSTLLSQQNMPDTAAHARPSFTSRPSAALDSSTSGISPQSDRSIVTASSGSVLLNQDLKFRLIREVRAKSASRSSMTSSVGEGGSANLPGSPVASTSRGNGVNEAGLHDAIGASVVGSDQVDETSEDVSRTIQALALEPTKPSRQNSSQ